MAFDLNEAGVFRLCDHHGTLVLPFGFSARRDRAGRFEQSPRWKKRTFRGDDPEDAERTGYFLPYIRRFLFPGGEPGAAELPPGAACRRFLFDWSSLGEGAAPPAENGTGLVGTLGGQDNQDNLPFECRVRLGRAELLLFPFEVGFLVLEFRCEQPGATYTDLMKALGMLRMLAPWYAGQPLPVWDVGGRRFHVPQLVAHLLAEFGDGPARPQMPLPDEPAEVRLPVKLIHDDRMMLYAYACLDRDTCPGDMVHAEKILRKRAVFNFDRHCAQQAEQNREKGARAWQRVRWESFAKDGGLLVAFNVDAFEEKYLGLYHRTYYFDVYLLALLQRVTLLTLYERLSDIPGLTTGGGRGRRLLRRLRHDLLLFKNQCCFSQITLRERGLILWKKWQETLENDTLLREVNEQSQELDSYLHAQHRERMEWLLRLGGFLAATVPIVLGLEVLFGTAEWVADLKWILLIALIVGTGAAASWILFRKPRMD
ncbi:MAG TPA: hypothetical protein VIL46_05735 [Gemmataceae bacterium]